MVRLDHLCGVFTVHCESSFRSFRSHIGSPQHPRSLRCGLRVPSARGGHPVRHPRRPSRSSNHDDHDDAADGGGQPSDRRDTQLCRDRRVCVVAPRGGPSSSRTRARRRDNRFLRIRFRDCSSPPAPRTLVERCVRFRLSRHSVCHCSGSRNLGSVTRSGRRRLGAGASRSSSARASPWSRCSFVEDDGERGVRGTDRRDRGGANPLPPRHRSCPGEPSSSVDSN